MKKAGHLRHAIGQFFGYVGLAAHRRLRPAVEKSSFKHTQVETTGLAVVGPGGEPRL